MPFVEVHYSGPEGVIHTEQVEVDHDEHLRALGPAVLEMQAKMNEFLTSEMQKISGVKVPINEPDVLIEDE
jgi:hypothetical protein